MKLDILEYDRKWIQFGFLNETELDFQVKEFEKGEDTNTEHYRYKSFLNWIINNEKFTDQELDNFICLVQLDKEQTMAKSVLVKLFKSPKLNIEQYDNIKGRLREYGNWGEKIISKFENQHKESFNDEFCEYLEHHLCETFRNSRQKEIRSLWCDGIVYNYNSKRTVNNKRKIETMAWIGLEGQDEFKMIIKFGKYSLRRYAKGCLLYTSPSPRDQRGSRMPSSA